MRASPAAFSRWTEGPPHVGANATTRSRVRGRSGGRHRSDLYWCMCGRYTLRRVDLTKAGFDALPEPGFEEFTERPRFNIAPSQDIAVVRLNRDGVRGIGPVRWGLIPHWAKDVPKVRPINARAETVRTSGMFKQAFARRRCIVPGDGFYEWKKVDAKTKQPMFVHFPDDRPFGFAGLWERWRPDADTEPVDTCTIVTTTPNHLMAPIHDRMPVILRPADYGRWLNPETDADEAAALMRPYPDGELEAISVEQLVNSPKNDVPECVKSMA
jgi:putative SOS response-associated peptidase YedK